MAEEGARNLICNMPEREVDCDALQVVYPLCEAFEGGANEGAGYVGFSYLRFLLCR